MSDFDDDSYFELLHNIHPYPAKFPSFVAKKYIGSNFKTILDPFCGSGTTVLEATKKNIKAFGFDCNPISTLISKSKLLKLSPQAIESQITIVNKYFLEPDKLPKKNLLALIILAISKKSLQS